MSSSSSSSSESLDYLTECPHCRKQFNETTRKPHRLPCCAEAVCQDCVNFALSDGRFICPLCQKEDKSKKNVSCLPLDDLAMKLVHMLHLNSLAIPCGYCFSKRDGVAICRQCVDVLCQSCLSTHSRSTLPIDHTVRTFVDIKLSRPNGHNLPRQLSFQSMSILGQLKDKQEGLRSRIGELEDMLSNITISKKRSTDDISKTFAKLIKDLQARRDTLISETERRATKCSREVSIAKASHVLLHGKVKKLSNNVSSGRKGSARETLSLLQESAVDVQYARSAVTFVPANIQHIISITATAGQVRTVTFIPAPKPDGVPNAATFNAITIEPSFTPAVSDEDVGFLSHGAAHTEQTCSLGDQVVVLKSGGNTKTLYCPYLEWDTGTASKNLVTSRTVSSNSKPDTPLPNTGCRIQADRHVMTTRPLLMRNGQRAFYQLKVNFFLKMALQRNKMLFETALTESPVDSCWNKSSGLSVNIANCPEHEQLCLHIVYNTQLLGDVPVSTNEAGVSHTLQLGFLLHSARNEIHVFDLENVSVVCSVEDVDFDKPLWVMMMLSYPSWANMAAAIVSGTRISVSRHINKLLASYQ